MPLYDIVDGRLVVAGGQGSGRKVGTDSQMHSDMTQSGYKHITTLDNNPPTDKTQYYKHPESGRNVKLDTGSGKWAHYKPGDLAGKHSGVGLASLHESILKHVAAAYDDLETKVFKIQAIPEVMARFEKFLAHVQWCAGVGHSTCVAMDIDGDGADRFKVLSPKVAKSVEITDKDGVERV